MEFSNVMGLDIDTAIPWIKSFADVFNNPTAYYDGYIQKVTYDLSTNMIVIQAYLVDDGVKIKKIRDSCTNWEAYAVSSIKQSILKAATTISALEAVKITEFELF